MKLYERLYSRDLWHPWATKVPLLQQVSYDLSGEYAEFRNEWMIYYKSVDLYSILEDMHTALICAVCSYLESLELSRQAEAHYPQEELPSDPMEQIRLLEPYLKQMGKVHLAGNISRYFLDDVFLRMHAYVEHAYVLAAYLIKRPG